MICNTRRRAPATNRSKAPVLAAVLAALFVSTAPASADAVLGDYLDRFDVVDYGNSDGSLLWESEWVESNDDADPASGAVMIGVEPHCVSDKCLVIGIGGAESAYVSRSADLSAADRALLSFDRKRHQHVGGTGFVRLSVSASGTGSWATLAVWQLDVTDPQPIVEQHDISPWMTASTAVRFELIGSQDGSHVNIDNLRIELLADDNLPPVLDFIPDRTIDEGARVEFTATATDADQDDTLSFRLDGTQPAGATITAGGSFTWTPTESQGPGTYAFDVIVSDDGEPSLSDRQTVTLTVREVNAPPTLNPISEQVGDEGSLVSFRATGVDAETPAADLVFAISGGPPAGAAMTQDGVFTWIPTERQGPGTYTFDVVVFDVGDPVLADTQSITVSVAEKNTAPTLAPIADQSGDEGVELSFTADASDADFPRNLLAYRLEGAPAGAVISPTGAFSWTPTDEQGPGIFRFDVIVVDNGDPALSDRQSVTFTVAEANNAPVIDPIGTLRVAEGELATFTAEAVDPDSPANTFWFGLSGAPLGAAITAQGVFTWIPHESQGPGTYEFHVVATDTGSPSRSSSRVVRVVVAEVNQPPQLNLLETYYAEAGSPFHLSIAADDADLPAQKLSYAVSGLPEGAQISETGELSWQPSDDALADSYGVQITVSDDGSPPLSATAMFSIRVVGPNLAPVLRPIGDKWVEAGEMLTFVAVATDEDGPSDELTYSLSSQAPRGSAINPSSGVFQWRPSQAQDDTTYAFAVTVTDRGAVPKTDSETITVTVGRPNVPPQVARPPDQRSIPGESIALSITGSDPDDYPEPLSFAAFNLPPGLDIDPTSGEITGIIGFDGIEGSPYAVEIVISDGSDAARVEFQWQVLGVANPPASSNRQAVVGSIATARAIPAASIELDSTIDRSLILMARAVSSSATQMSRPFLLLLLVLGAVVWLGRIGVGPVLRRGTKHSGILVRYDLENASGLVARSGDGAEVFVHTSAIARRDRGKLIPGDLVEFRTVDGAYRDLVTKLRKRRRG